MRWTRLKRSKAVLSGRGQQDLVRKTPARSEASKERDRQETRPVRSETGLVQTRPLRSEVDLVWKRLSSIETGRVG